jgi:hypothetical protein
VRKILFGNAIALSDRRELHQMIVRAVEGWVDVSDGAENGGEPLAGGLR